MSYLSADSTRGQPEAGPQERLSRSGDNIANVIQYLGERHPQILESVFRTLRQRVPRIERVFAEPMPDGRLLFADQGRTFSHPVLARFASDRTLRCWPISFCCTTPRRHRSSASRNLDNFLHPRLLPELAEECRAASARTQFLVTTHSPFFLNALRSNEVRVLWRDEAGYTQARRVSDLPGVREFVEHGALLGHLWMEGQLGVGDPLVNEGAPSRPQGTR